LNSYGDLQYKFHYVHDTLESISGQSLKAVKLSPCELSSFDNLFKHLVSHDVFIVANFNGRFFDKINSFSGLSPKPCLLRTHVSSKIDQALKHCFNELVVADKVWNTLH